MAEPKIHIEEGVIDPKEREKLERSILSREQAPTSAEQTPDQTTWQRQRDELGPPFDPERITIKQMRQLRKDPMIAFGLHYLKVPLVRAEWHIEARDKDGPNAQVAAFVDAALRQIYARLIFQRCRAYDYGYSAIVKRFQLANPGGVYEDPRETNPENRIKPIWDEGSVLPKIWKVPVPLRPERVMPRFLETGTNAGDFDGMLYDVPPAQRTKAMGFQSGRQKGNQAQRVIDVYHSYWATNQKDEEEGSIFGYPRTGFARFYWWTYNMLAHMSNRAYERLAIPPVLAFHPPGSTLIDPETNETQPNWEIALEMADRLRMNAVAAVPSTMADKGMGEQSGTQREWDFKFLETPHEALGVFDARFNYLNMMKLRSLWVPELAFVSNQSGGNSGGNIAEQMAEIFTESQAIEKDIIDDEINRVWIPHLLWLNFPEFVNNGGVARIVSHGFRKEDMEFYKQVIQLLGQADPATIARIDTSEIFRRLNMPLRESADYEQEVARIIAEAGRQGTPLVPPVAGQGVGVIANPNFNPGFTNGGSVPQPNAPGALAAAGFSFDHAGYGLGGDQVYDGNGIRMGEPHGWNQPTMYIQPRDYIDLELADAEEFLTGLPSSKHYTDKTIRALTMQLRRLWSAHYRRVYPEFARYVKKLDSLEFEDEGHSYIFNGNGMMEFAGKGKPKRSQFVTKKQADKAARKIIDGWKTSSTVLNELAAKSAAIMRKIADRAAKLDIKNSKLEAEIAEDAFDDFLSEQTARLIKFTSQTTKDELQGFLVNNIREGRTKDEIADEIIAHFQSFPQTKADRVARSETRDTVNAATLISAEAAGVRYVRQTDGEEFDEECKKRNGTLATVREAWKNLRNEHPYGTLGFDPIPRANFSIEYVHQMPEKAPEGYSAWFDDNTDTAYIIFGEDGTEDYLTVLADRLVSAS